MSIEVTCMSIVTMADHRVIIMWMKKLATVLLPLASFLVLVATRKVLCEATLRH